MAMFATYYDTSGAENRAGVGEVMVTAGMVGSEKQWLGFETEWNAALERAGVTYLHMKEIVQLFGSRTSDMDVLLQRAVKIIRKRALRCFVVTVGVPDYNAVNEEFELTETVGGAFALCAGSCAYLADHWFRQCVYADRTLVHYHESGDDSIGAAQAFARRHSINLNTKQQLEDGKYFRPFEATDLISWETRRAYEQIMKQLPYKLRPSLERLAFDLKTERHYYDYERMREKCIREGISRRAA